MHDDLWKLMQNYKCGHKVNFLSEENEDVTHRYHQWRILFGPKKDYVVCIGYLEIWEILRDFLAHLWCQDLSKQFVNWSYDLEMARGCQKLHIDLPKRSEITSI